ncbi:LPFR motif small protein [Streptomyces sp. NPDC048231]
MFHAIADALRRIGGALGTLVALPFRALARFFGAASGPGRGGARRA